MSKQSINPTEPVSSNYHHGDLRATLLKEANEMVRESGVEAISLRKLSSRVGVSRTAPYHHFKNKNELLCAIAEQGFCLLDDRIRAGFNNDNHLPQDKLYGYVHGYVKFAKDNPELYELMFGRTIWKQQISTEDLRTAAYPCFQHQVKMIGEWQKSGLLDKNQNTLRLSQVIWGTLHGIAKLLIDGIYTQTSQVEEICDCAVELFGVQSKT